MAMARKQQLALAVLLASLCTIHSSFHANALSLPGRRLTRRQAARTSTELGHDHHKAYTPHDEQQFDLSSRSPAFSSALFTSPNYRRARNSRQRRIAQHRRSFVRREGNFQLNFKDVDDDDDVDEHGYLVNNIIESQQPLKRSIFGKWRKRKSLSKALFPPLEEVDSSSVLAEEYGVDDDYLVPFDVQLDNAVQDAAVDAAGHMDEEILDHSRTTVLSKPTIGLAKKIPLRKKNKKDQVVVSNIKELHEAILEKGYELRDVELKYSPPPSLLTSNWQEQPAETSTAAKLESGLSNNLDEIQHILSTAHNNDIMPEVELEGNSEPNAEEWQLIGNVLAEDNPICTEEEEKAAKEQASKLFSHDVLNLLHKRYHSQSTPGSRAPDDTDILALSVEGGGMRGAVSGGMAAAIACLGLSNSFDSIYGSSAGSIIGSYFVSRQLYLDVYTDVIPAGKDLFVSKSKIIGDIFRNMFYVIKARSLGNRLNANVIERFRNPTAGSNATQLESLPPTRAGGLNISFVLDTIMCPERGLRPLDLEAFAHNDAVQPLRIVSSAVELETGKLKSVCFGSKEGHFRDSFANPAVDQTTLDSMTGSEYLYPELASAQADEDGNRRGMWACLGASMTVPGAAGSPFRMDLPSSNTKQPAPHLCFDAFCYEPVPFRSAVAEGATHVVALRSRPASFEPKTKPTLYERAVAPLYFRSNGVPDSVAEFFEKGGQQYLYAEDVLLCDEGLDSTEAIPIPPAQVLYAASEADGITSFDKDKKNWARAHLLPITVPADVPEIGNLCQDRDEILAGIRTGFAAAFDALAPVVGLESGPDSLNGLTVAELVFQTADAHESVLVKQTPLPGEKLGETLNAATEQDIIPASTQSQEPEDGADLSSPPQRYQIFRRVLSKRGPLRFRRRDNGNVKVEASVPEVRANIDTSPPAQDAYTLQSFLPGVQLGSLPLVAERLQTYLESRSYLEG